MKKIFLTTGLLSVLTMPALADVKWFVGGGLGYASPVFSDLIDDAIDADLQGSIGFDVGVKYTF